MPEYRFRLAVEKDRPAILAFMNRHWGSRHPLVNRPEWFDFYYCGAHGRLRFALAEHGAQLAAIAGYIPASLREDADIWVSIWVADKAAKGSGLELMAALPALTGCRTLACNNIRPETRPFYEFLGHATGRLEHFYRLAPNEEYRLARVRHKVMSPAGGRAALTRLADEAALLRSGFVPPQNANPYKDLWYIARRYFHFPHQQYRLYAAALPGDACPRALLAVRVAPAAGTVALRIVDFVGETAFFPEMGRALDELLRQAGAEYADMYAAGLAPHLAQAAGFARRCPDDGDVIPNYLNPPLHENTEYYYFTSRPQGFTLFKADGDQDRPNLPVPGEEA